VAQSAIEPFFTTKDVGQGSGLGLSQVYGVVQQSNGALRIDSRLGVGTVVHLYLPRTTALVPAVTAPLDYRQDQPPQARILLVDDNDEVREITEQMLREAGFVTAAVDSGHAALVALAGDDGVDLLIIDIAMPGMNGIETVRRAREQRPDLKVLYITGFADVGGDGSAEDDLRLNKPFRLAELIAAVRRVLEAGSRIERDKIPAFPS
jgi:CheY-like chemotaxis protein